MYVNHTLTNWCILYYIHNILKLSRHLMYGNYNYIPINYNTSFIIINHNIINGYTGKLQV